MFCASVEVGVLFHLSSFATVYVTEVFFSVCTVFLQFMQSFLKSVTMPGYAIFSCSNYNKKTSPRRFIIHFLRIRVFANSGFTFAEGRM